MFNLIIIVNFYNSEKTIKKMIKSIIDQKYKPKEVYLFNNSSTDQSKKIVLEMIKNHKNFFYEDTKSFLPLVKARNYSIMFVKKNTRIKNFYFSFCDSDDIWSNNWISIMSKYYKFSYDLMICNSILQTKNQVSKISSGLDHFFSDPYFCPIYLNTVMFNSRLITSKKKFFDDNFELLYDIDYWISNFDDLSYISISNTLSTYIKHGNNLSSTKKFQIFIERLKILRKHNLSILKFFFKTLLRFFK